MKHLLSKLEAIKEKVKRLASNLEVLRSENHEIIEENKKLRIKLRKDAAEIRLLTTQLAHYKAKIEDKVLEKAQEQEEEFGKGRKRKKG